MSRKLHSLRSFTLLVCCAYFIDLVSHAFTNIELHATSVQQILLIFIVITSCIKLIKSGTQVRLNCSSAPQQKRIRRI